MWHCAVPSFTCFRMVCVPTGARGAMEGRAVLVICIAACLVGGSNPVGAAGFPFLVRRRDVSAPSAVRLRSSLPSLPSGCFPRLRSLLFSAFPPTDIYKYRETHGRYDTIDTSTTCPVPPVDLPLPLTTVRRRERRDEAPPTAGAARAGWPANGWFLPREGARGE